MNENRNDADYEAWAKKLADTIERLLGVEPKDPMQEYTLNAARDRLREFYAAVSRG